jgi:hypothetical protein
MLGLREVDTFDAELILYINSAFSVLHQLNIGPATTFTIQDDTKQWKAFTKQNHDIEMVKEYVFLSVKNIFDSQSMSGAVLEAHQNRKKELEWRLQANAETDI